MNEHLPLRHKFSAERAPVGALRDGRFVLPFEEAAQMAVEYTHDTIQMPPRAVRIQLLARKRQGCLIGNS
jgi:hypothetical protein